MAKGRDRYAEPRRPQGGGGLWTSEEFVFGLTGGAAALTERRDTRYRKLRR
ncbi:MAG: hypothetical protein QNJ30_05005 [Kiloniellales bacterium]|nr:hypothetical protein [Kiloniellales bacterium]